MSSMRKTIRIYQGFFIPTVIYLVCTLVVFRGILPGIETVRKFYDDSNQIARDVEAIRQHVRVLQNLDETVLSSQVDTLVAAVPTGKNFPTMLSTIDTMASQVGASLIGLEIMTPGSIATGSALPPAKPDPQLSKNTIFVEANVNGTGEQVNAFLDLLVGVRRLLRVSQANVAYEPEDIVKTSLTIEGFFAPLPEVLSKPTDKIEPLSAKHEELIARLNSYNILGQDMGPPQLVPGDKTNPFSL
ncbi:hypothetical protein A2Z33_01120 [Candidatus Gottesmanbacteria bacterium RBG_16_52_11]|uniref:Pilus assembly protein PilO n=1 Tax=Candidatus Gottesmanbacteria bacterium RBG_16_52_11 TaxID=1798374 RepID=A0A1F5YNY3_9BACT|nr:MAG: hypothetical protein A2Z33_01120 [Candidatus Gottesmanbacteria bacterium RBG_16_52_11]